MSQYVLLRKENDLLNSLIGQSFNQKSKFEAEKILTEIHSKAESRMIGKKALCYIVDNLEIKGVGGSTLLKDKKTNQIKSNLILDNFGEFMQGIFKKVDTIRRSVSLIDTGGVVGNSVSTYADSSIFNIYGSALGVLLQVGSGSIVPARTDFKIQTAFGTAPESSDQSPSTNPVWNSGLGNFKQGISMQAGGAGTINESVLHGRWEDSGDIVRTFALFRDIISPGQAFVLGQSIALEYTIQL